MNFKSQSIQEFLSTSGLRLTMNTLTKFKLVEPSHHKFRFGWKLKMSKIYGFFTTNFYYKLS